MLIKSPPSWMLPESAATPEHVFNNRRALLKGVAGGLIAGALPLGVSGFAARPAWASEDPSAGLYPVKRDLRYKLDRPLTDESLATKYNNFYEYGSQKSISDAAQALKIRPWTIEIAGMVDKPFTIGIDDLLKKMPLEERLYRHRCVEAWSMAVPWSGFPLKALVDLAKPLGSAKYVAMQTFLDKGMAPGQRQVWYPWPYTEGLTVAEATNDVAFMVTGIYGHPLPKQNGAPLRLAVPWKYGFKSIKSIVRFEFTDKRPETFWWKLQSSEYGFWANVNPEVPHPRWSQATERVLGTGDRVPTLKWNGYGEQVAHLYDNLKGEPLFR
jgi:sulfoxide reductase catalytic subunit YedY